MKKYLLFIALCLWVVNGHTTVVNYTADDTSIFSNPERGFTEELGGETMLSDSRNHVVKEEGEEYFTNAAQQSQSLVMLMYYLGNYKSKNLSNAILQGFDEDMQILREHGFKCVLRFAYDWNSKNDAALSYVKKHIASLKPYLAKNADVIYVLETGFVGRWGEWYYSSNFGNETQHLNDNRRQVLEAMLDACPANRFLLARYAMIKTEYFGDTKALTSAEAFTGTTRARLGHHNDAFLNAYGNDGTYDDGNGKYTAMRNYISQETLYVPNGGETNVEKSSLANTVSKHDTTFAELRRFHWSFCGSQYSEQVTNKWRTNGTFDDMNRLLGYRYQLMTATLPGEGKAGHDARFVLKIKNVGCAPLYNERHAYIVLKNQQSVFSIQLQSDPRRWLPNGEVTTIDETLTIPSEMSNGTYQLYLYMPDASASIASDPRYAVRFANTDVWDAETGMNDLHASIEITGSSTGFEQTNTAPQIHKIMRDGQLLILKNGKTFTIQGTELF